MPLLHLAVSLLVVVVAAASTGPQPSPAAPAPLAPLGQSLWVTWYGNPHSATMGVLGRARGADRAAALRRQAEEYRRASPAPVTMAYHLVAVVAQPQAGRDGKWRRRESRDVIRALHTEARQHGFQLILDVQVGRSTVASELEHLAEFLREPDVHLALDPEFAMGPSDVPGKRIGRLHAADVNTALDVLDRTIATHGLPRKLLIVHQFTLGMLPDKPKIRQSRVVDVVLMMDGFGDPPLKRAAYRMVMRQHRLPFAGVKLFYKQDTRLMSAEQVLALDPRPSVITYQ